ncbi:VWA domain-containing protein [bacterium]
MISRQARLCRAEAEESHENDLSAEVTLEESGARHDKIVLDITFNEVKMDFSGKIYLITLLLIPAVILLLIVLWKNKIKTLKVFGDYSLINNLIPQDTWEKQRIKMVLWVSALFFLLIALCGPQFGAKMMNIKRTGIDVIIAVDTSLSMMAEDIAPSRIEKAKQELSKLITNLEGNRLGIIAFAGNSFLQCPLTLDAGAARLFLDFVDVGTVPRQGTEIGTAIRLAIKTFSKKERKYKALVLLSDGEDHKSGPAKAAEEAKKEGINIFTIGFGSTEGEVIPIKAQNGSIIDYKKDKKGKTIVSRMDETLLKKIAFTTRGKYYRATLGQIEAERIAEAINNMEKKELKSAFRSQFEERFYYFAIIGLLLLIIEKLIKETRGKND